MTIIVPMRRRRDTVALYRRFAENTNNLHVLSGREDHIDRTRAMTREILRRVDFSASDRVLDIGCGDASLLAQIPFAASRTGTVLTTQEADRLRATHELSNIQFYTASFESLSDVPGIFDRIVANSCFHFTGTDANARRALTSIAGRLAPGGKLWLGELFGKKHNREFASKLRAIRYVYRHKGAPTALAFARHIVRNWRRADRFILPSERVWYGTRSQVVDHAGELGLHLVGMWSCQQMTNDPFYSLQDRFSVLFQKA